jgi:hypothetical protein
MNRSSDFVGRFVGDLGCGRARRDGRYWRETGSLQGSRRSAHHFCGAREQNAAWRSRPLSSVSTLIHPFSPDKLPTRMIRKAYVDNWRDSADGIHIDLRFRSNAKDARLFKSEVDAQAQCEFFSKSNVIIPSNEGGTYTLREFKVQQLGPMPFVIVCEGPFLQG